MNISDEALKLILGDRNKSYGHPDKNFGALAKVWTGMIQARPNPEEDLTAREVCLMMAGMKLVREMFQHKPDNNVDAIGYIHLGHWVTTGIEPERNEVDK